MQDQFIEKLAHAADDDGGPASLPVLLRGGGGVVRQFIEELALAADDDGGPASLPVLLRGGEGESDSL